MIAEIIYINVPQLIADLRSGEFTQGPGYLHRVDADTYCCLGVACERMSRNGLIDTEEFTQTNFGETLVMTEYIVTPANYETRELPPGVKFPDYMGIRGGFGVLPEMFRDRNDSPVDLAELNDERMTFSQIADILEYLHVNNAVN